MRAIRSSETVDSDAFAAFYRRHERGVATFLMRRTGPRGTGCGARSTPRRADRRVRVSIFPRSG